MLLEFVVLTVEYGILHIIYTQKQVTYIPQLTCYEFTLIKLGITTLKPSNTTKDLQNLDDPKELMFIDVISIHFKDDKWNYLTKCFLFFA